MADLQASSRIFISYRREDSSGHVLALLPALRKHFGDRIFKDTDNIPPGEDFVKFIKQELQSCSVLLAIIGRDWLTIQDPRLKTRRLDNPDDFLRVELSTALKSERIRVIPVLVERSSMPEAVDLPADIAELAQRNALELSDVRWESDVQLLVQAIQRACAGAMPADEPAQRPELQDVQKRRAREIAGHLAAARTAFGARDYETTLAACEKALLIDPQNAEALDLLDQARTINDEQRIQAWLGLGKQSLDQGDIARASDFIDQALALDPASESALALRKEMLAIRRERERGGERARRVAGAVERARSRMEEQDFGSAVRHADEALTFEPQSVEAQTLRSRALASLEERRRERDGRRRADAAGTPDERPAAEAPGARPQQKVEPAGPQIATTAMRPHRRYAVIAAVVMVILVAIGAIGQWYFRRSAPPGANAGPAPGSSVGAAAKPQAETRPPTSPPAASPAPAEPPAAVVTAPKPSPEQDLREQKLKSVRQKARDQFQQGQRQALNTVMDGLGIAPGDPDLQSILDSLLRDAQRTTRRAKDAAVIAGAPRYAGDTHQQALKLEKEATAQETDGRKDAAVRTLWRAEELFDRAERDARVELAQQKQLRDAQAAAARQNAARGSAQPAGTATSSGSAVGAASTTGGNRSASNPVRASDTPPAKPAASSPALDLEKARIVATLQRYAAGYSALNAAAVYQVYPAEATWQFSEFDYYTLRLEDLAIEVAGDAATATVSCNAIHAFKRKGVAAVTEKVRQTFTLRKRNNAWIIVSATYDRGRR